MPARLSLLLLDAVVRRDYGKGLEAIMVDVPQYFVRDDTLLYISRQAPVMDADAGFTCISLLSFFP